MTRPYRGRLAAIIAMAVAMAACSYLPSTPEREMRRKADRIEETDERMVVECLYLGTVAAEVDPRTIPERYAIKKGRQLARRYAAEIGATHIVWLYSHQSAASAKAYDCHQAPE